MRSGILDYARWLELNATEEVLRESFPNDQLVYEIRIDDPNYAGFDPMAGFACELEWVTLIYSEIEYRRGEPYFAATRVRGYYTGTTATSVIFADDVTNSLLEIPANLYPGPILPNNPRNVPVTIVNMNFYKGTLTNFQRTLALIQNWEPGVPIGDPTLDERYTEILDPTTSTLLLSLDTAEVIYEETFGVRSLSSIPQEILDLGVVNYYARSISTTTYTLIGTGTFTNGLNTLQIDTVTSQIGTGTWTIKAVWPGRRNYIRTESNTETQTVLAGIPLEVVTTVTPSPITPLPTTATVVATATVASQYLPLSAGINSTATVTLAPNARSSATTRISTTTFQSGNLSVSFDNIDITWLDRELSNSSTYTILTSTLTSSSYIITATVTTPVSVLIAWDAYRPSRLARGSLSTSTTVIGTRTYVQPRIPMTVTALEQIGSPGMVSLTATNQTYSTQGPYIQFRVTATNSVAFNTASVTVRALYTTTQEPAGFVQGTTSSIYKRVLMPMMHHLKWDITKPAPGGTLTPYEVQLNLNSVQGIQTGSNFLLPGTTYTFTTTYITDYQGLVYDDAAITAEAILPVPIPNYDLSQYVNTNVTINNPDGSSVIKTITDQYRRPYRINYNNNTYSSQYVYQTAQISDPTPTTNVGCIPNEIRLENTTGLEVGDKFKIIPNTSTLYYNGALRPVLFNTATEFTIMSIQGDSVICDPPWGAAAGNGTFYQGNYPNYWINRTVNQSDPVSFFEIVQTLRHSIIEFRRDSLADPQSIVARYTTGWLANTYPNRLYVNSVGSVLPGAQISLQSAVPIIGATSLSTATIVQSVNTVENWLELDRPQSDIHTLGFTGRPIAVNNPNEYISVNGTRTITPIEVTLLGQSDTQWRFDVLPLNLDITDTFTVNSQQFPIKNITTETKTITSIRPTFNIAPYIGSVIDFNLTSTNYIYNFEYVCDQFGQRVNGDGLQPWIIEPNPEGYFTRKYYGRLKFTSLPEDLQAGDYLTIDTGYVPSEIPAPLALNANVIRVRLLEVNHALNWVRPETEIFTIQWQNPYWLYLFEYLPTFQFENGFRPVIAANWPIRFSRYNAASRQTYSDLNTYQSVSLGTVLTSTFSAGVLTWDLTTATLNTGTYYVTVDPGTPLLYDPRHIPRTPDGYWKLLVEPYLSTQFVGKWRPGISQDTIEVFNYETENFEQGITWHYNGNFIGTSTWARSGTRQISTLTLNTTTIIDPALVQGSWPGTREDYRDSITDREYSSATILVSSVAEGTLTISNPPSANFYQPFSITALFTPRTGDFTDTKPQGILTWTLNTATFTSTFVNSWQSTLTLSSSSVQSVVGTSSTYFSTMTANCALSLDPFYVGTATTTTVLVDYVPGRIKNFYPPPDNFASTGLFNCGPGVVSADPYGFVFTTTWRTVFYPGALPVGTSAPIVLLRKDITTPTYSGQQGWPYVVPEVRDYNSANTLGPASTTDFTYWTESWTYDSDRNQYVMTVQFNLRVTATRTNPNQNTLWNFSVTGRLTKPGIDLTKLVQSAQTVNHTLIQKIQSWPSISNQTENRIKINIFP